MSEGEAEEPSTPEEYTQVLKDETFKIRDEAGKVPEGDDRAAIMFWAKTIEMYCKLVPKVANLVQEYFQKENVPIELIKALDIYYHTMNREMKNFQILETDPNMKKAIEQAVIPLSKPVETMVNIARKVAAQRGASYDEDY